MLFLFFSIIINKHIKNIMILDNNGSVEIKATLTRLGKQRINENRFRPIKFSISDDNINYNLIDNTLIVPDIKVERIPFFDVFKDGASLIKNRVLYKVNKQSDLVPSRGNFRITLNTESTINNEQTINGVTVENINKGKTTVNGRYTSFPELIVSDTGVKTIIYFINSSVKAKEIHDSKINISFSSLGSYKLNQFITVTLHSQKYFDIRLSPENVQQNLNFNNSSKSLKRNFDEARSFQSLKIDLPKVINVICDDMDLNSFELRYNGNFVYENTSISSYNTLLTIFSEETGQFENIKIIIKLI